MSQATSDQGKTFAANFVAGFEFVNGRRIQSGTVVANERVYRKAPEETYQDGDIDFGCVIAQESTLDELLHGLNAVIPPANANDVIPAATYLHVQATTQPASVIVQSSQKWRRITCSYVDKKVWFHAGMMHGANAFALPTGATSSYLLLIYNGSDRQLIGPQFDDSMRNEHLRGAAVWCSTTNMSRWLAVLRHAESLETERQGRLAAEGREETERQARLAAEGREAAERQARENADNQIILLTEQLEGHTSKKAKLSDK